MTKGFLIRQDKNADAPDRLDQNDSIKD